VRLFSFVKPVFDDIRAAYRLTLHAESVNARRIDLECGPTPARFTAESGVHLFCFSHAVETSALDMAAPALK
jgi:hypothetical protein